MDDDDSQSSEEPSQLLSLGFEAIPSSSDADFYEYRDSPADFSPTERTFGFEQPQGYHILEGDEEEPDQEAEEDMLTELKRE